MYKLKKKHTLSLHNFLNHLVHLQFVKCSHKSFVWSISIFLYVSIPYTVRKFKSMHVKSFQLFSFENFHVIWRLQFHVENIFSKINMIDMIQLRRGKWRYSKNKAVICRYLKVCGNIRRQIITNHISIIWCLWYIRQSCTTHIKLWVKSKNN